MENYDNNLYKNVPFEEKNDYNFLTGYFYSLFLALFKPKSFFMQMHVNKGLKQPVIFAVISICLSVFFSNLYIFLKIVPSVPEQLKELMTKLGQTEVVDKMSEMPAYDASLSSQLTSIILYVVFLLLTASLWNSILSFFKIARNGFEATFRILLYGTAIRVLTIIPVNIAVTSNLLLKMGFEIWGFVIVYIGIKELHEIKGSKAIAGFLSYIALTFFLGSFLNVLG